MLTIEQSQPHPDGLIREASVSDLFFNYEHPAYDKVVAYDAKNDAADERHSDLEVHRALYSDAVDFANTLDRATGVKLDPLQLVDDFLRRL